MSIRQQARLYLGLVLGIGMALGFGAGAQTLPAGVTRGPSMGGITEYNLANGLKVLLLPDPSQDTITVNVTYLVGSRHESYGERGMAHLLEHMLFKGTPRYASPKSELLKRGARYNGTTSFDRTNYFETFPASDELLAFVLDLEADRMVNARVSRQDLESEMTVVRNEFEAGQNSPFGLLRERMNAAAYLWHNYGRSVIGTLSDIENVPIERLQAFYRTWYRPDNTVLVVAGKLDEERTLALVQEKFGAIKNPGTPLPTTYTVEPAQDGARTVTLRRVGDKQVVSLGYHIPASAHPDHAALEVLAFLLADEPAGRLHKALVETQKATAVSANADQFKDASLMYVESQLRETGSPDEVQAEMVRIVEGFAQDPPAANEVQRAKTKLLRDWELTMRDSPRAAVQLSEWASLGDWRMIFLYRDLMEKVAVEDVVRVADAYFEESNRTLGLYIPTEAPSRVEIPAAPVPATLLAGYKGRDAMAQGETFDTSPEAVEARTTRTELANGMKLVMLPKETRGETVNVDLRLHVGDETSLRNRGRTARLTGSMLMRGTTTKSRQDIEDRVDALKATLHVSGYESAVDASLEATRATLPDALRLLADVLRNPSFPPSELKQLRESALQEQEEAKSDPRARAMNAVYRHLASWPADDVRYVQTPDEAIAALQKIEVADLKKLHEELYGASAAEIAIVGDFDAKEVGALVGELFGGWKSRKTFSRLVTPHQDHPALVETIETPDKESGVMQAGVRVPMRDDDEDYPKLVIGNFMTGGGFLSSRLAKRIREDEGLSYGVGSSFSASSLDESAWFSAYAIYAPQNDAKVVAAFREEIDRILKDGFAPDEVTRAKEGWLQSRDVARGRDALLASTLREQSYLGRTMAWDEKLEAAVSAAGNDAIVAAFRRAIDPAAMTIVRAGDFAKSAEEKPAEKDHASR
ncbi:MAG: M16 family metallopeptidase [bacterium]